MVWEDSVLTKYVCFDLLSIGGGFCPVKFGRGLCPEGFYPGGIPSGDSVRGIMSWIRSMQRTTDSFCSNSSQKAGREVRLRLYPSCNSNTRRLSTCGQPGSLVYCSCWCKQREIFGFKSSIRIKRMLVRTCEEWRTAIQVRTVRYRKGPLSQRSAHAEQYAQTKTIG